MTIEKDMVTTTEKTVTEVKNAAMLIKKENTSKVKTDVSKEATEAVKSAVSQYIGELLEKEGTLAEIGEKLYTIDSQITGNLTGTANRNPSFERSLGNWLRKEAEPSLEHLCLLTQVNHVSYDHILGLDKQKDTNQLSYGYTLDFFFYLFRTKKVEIFRKPCSNLSEPVTTVATKGCFDMTRYFIFKDRTLCDIFKELNEQKVTDLQKRNKVEVESMYKKAFRRFISTYENMPLDSETCRIDTNRYDPLLPNNGQNNPSKEIYHGLPEDLAERIKSLPKKYGKNQAQFSKDAGISTSAFSGWINGRNPPDTSKLYLMAKTYGFSIDSLLSTGISDKNEKKHQYKYTYGNTLRFIDQLETAGVISKVINQKYFFQPTNNSTYHHKKNSDGKNPNNMNYLGDKELPYFPGLFFIKDDFLIRLITEIEAEMSRPFDAPQSPDTAQISYEISQSNVEKFIAKYDSESLFYYQGNARKALKDCSEKWHKYCYGHNDFFTSLLDMSVDLDEMLKELRAVEIDASKASLE